MFLLGFMFVIFVVFFIVIQERTIDLAARRDRIAMQELDNLVRVEIRNAQTFEDGYYREFMLPKLMNGRPYEIGVSADGWEIYIKHQGLVHINFLDAETFGNFTEGTNRICKKSGSVYLNECQGYMYT